MFERRVDQDSRVQLDWRRVGDVAGGAVRLDLYIFDWVRPIGKRPHYGIGIIRIDIFADCDDDLAAIGLPALRRPASRARLRFAACRLRIVRR